MSQLRQQYPKFQEMGLQVIAVGMGNPSEAAQFKRSRQLPFPLLSDTGQRVFTAYGLTHINPVQELRSNTMGALLRETMKGNLAGIPVGDITQLGGTFLVDQQGIVQYLRRDTSSSVYPSMPELLNAARQLLLKPSK